MRPKGLTDKQRNFVNEYLKDLNAAKAARRAGYSLKTAGVMGWQTLQRPEVKALIDEKLAEASLSAKETIKLISDIARGNMADYFITEMIERSSLVEKSLKAIIAEKKENIAFEKEFAAAAGYGVKEMKIHNALLKNMGLEVLRLEIELKHNPKAFRIVSGPSRLVEHQRLDINKIIADKERGRIKSVKPGEFGLQVEMYCADSALVQIAKMHGLFEKDNKQQAISITVGYETVEDE